MARFSDDSRERVRDAVDMIDLVGTRTELKRAGANRYQGLCPFHDERTPSFGIDPVNKLYHCFGCGAGGDCFKFVEETEGLRFGEAMQFLADRYGVELELEAEDPAETARRARRERLLELLERTAAFYVRYLWESEEASGARDYLAERGLEEGTLREFRVGYAPSAWDKVLLASRRAKFSNEEIVAAGLAVRGRSGGKIYDRFRRRITFPLCDARGRVLGFGARALGADQQPKYLNSPEGELYHKGRQLFAADIARAAAAKAQTVIVAEGYTDVLMLHQAGTRNAVGIMGTAMTAEQVGELARLAPTLLLALDADSAGQEAMVRAEKLARQRRLTVRVVPLPAGADPADLVAREGAKAVAQLVESSVPFVRFRVEKTLAAADLSSAEGKDAVIEELRPAFAPDGLPPSALREDLLKEVAERLQLAPSLVSSWLTAGAPRRATAGTGNGHAGAPVTPLRAPRPDAPERTFLAFCIAVPEAAEELLRSIEPERDLSSPLLRRAHSHLLGHLRAPAEGIAADDAELQALVAELAVTAAREPVDRHALAAQFVQVQLAAVKRLKATAPAGEMQDLARRESELQAELAKASARAMDASAPTDLD